MSTFNILTLQVLIRSLNDNINGQGLLKTSYFNIVTSVKIYSNHTPQGMGINKTISSFFGQPSRFKKKFKIETRSWKT